MTKFYSRYTYKKLKNVDNEFIKASKLINLCLRANKQIVFILSKYNFAKYSHSNSIREIVKVTNRNLIKQELEEIYYMITGKSIDVGVRKYINRNKIYSDTIIKEKDLIRLANLFRLVRIYWFKIDSLKVYLKKNSKLYKSIYNNDVDYGIFYSVRSALDGINCHSDAIFNKYGFLFYPTNLRKQIKWQKD